MCSLTGTPASAPADAGGVSPPPGLLMFTSRGGSGTLPASAGGTPAFHAEQYVVAVVYAHEVRIVAHMFEKIRRHFPSCEGDVVAVALLLCDARDVGFSSGEHPSLRLIRIGMGHSHEHRIEHVQIAALRREEDVGVGRAPACGDLCAGRDARAESGVVAFDVGRQTFGESSRGA